MARARPDLRMQAASIGPVFVDRAAAGFGVQKLAVTTGPARQTEDAVLEVEVLDHAGLGQAFGNLLGVFVLRLKGIDQPQPHQINQLDLHRHGAAIGRTGVAQPGPVAGPGVATVNINNSNGGSHGL